MILVVDMGNTDTVIGGIDETKTHLIERVTTDQGRTGTGYAMSFKNILEMHQTDIAGIEGAILSSVVPPINSTILNAMGKVTGNCPLLMGSGMKTGMNIIMGNPKTVGSDQTADVVAASHEHPSPLVAIGMGMATTLCTVDKRGNYIGDVILPGPKISLNPFSSKMAQLPYISLGAPSHAIGKDAISCTHSGIIYGSADMIDGILDRVEKELEEPPTIIATGGLTKFIMPLCRHKTLVDDTLLLKGPLILYWKNMEVH